MRITTLVFITVLSLESCYYIETSNKPLQKKIVGSADSCFAEGDTCILNLKAITAFVWDKLYIFDEYADKEEISEKLGFKYDRAFVPDQHYRMIFTFKQSVVYEENFSWSGSSSQKLEYIHTPVDTNSYSIDSNLYTRLLPYVSVNDSMFFVVKLTDEKDYSYGLMPVINVGKSYIIN